MLDILSRMCISSGKPVGAIQGDECFMIHFNLLTNLIDSNTCFNKLNSRYGLTKLMYTHFGFGLAVPPVQIPIMGPYRVCG